MERDANQVPESTMCRSGCGFYGSSATDGMCSKCYKDALRRKQSNPSLPGRGSPTASTSTADVAGSLNSSPVADVASMSTASTSVPVVSSASHESTASEKSSISDSISDDNQATPQDTEGDGRPTAENQDSSQKDKKKKNRCQTCRKKVGLTGFECRCGGTFCSLHRYSDKHDCTFNYRELGANEIRKNNPVVIGEKIQKI